MDFDQRRERLVEVFIRWSGRKDLPGLVACWPEINFGLASDRKGDYVLVHSNGRRTRVQREEVIHFERWLFEEGLKREGYDPQPRRLSEECVERTLARALSIPIQTFKTRAGLAEVRQRIIGSDNLEALAERAGFSLDDFENALIRFERRFLLLSCTLSPLRPPGDYCRRFLVVPPPTSTRH